MKPYGRTKKKSYPFKDVHPHPKSQWMNWWECIGKVSKKRERNNAKRNIKKDIEDENY